MSIKLLHDPKPHPLLCIEEPENQLHPDDDEDDYEEDGSDGGDQFQRMLVKVREQLMVGDYRVLYALWELHKYDDDEEEF